MEIPMPNSDDYESLGECSFVEPHYPYDVDVEIEIPDAESSNENLELLEQFESKMSVHKDALI